MANPWFRMYHEFATDPKVQMMPEVMQRRLLMLFCAQCSEMLETMDDSELAFFLRISGDELEATKKAFLAKEFIDERWSLVNWAKRQPESAKSTVRVKRFRNKRKQNETVRETDETVSPVSQDVSCAHGNAGEQNGTEEKREEENRTEPPIPPEAIAKAVQIETGILTDKAFRVLYDVAKREQLLGITPGAIKAAMVEAWQKFQVASPNLTYAWGAEKFFGEGYWKKPPEAWPWKQNSAHAPPPQRVYVNRPRPDAVQ